MTNSDNTKYKKHGYQTALLIDAATGIPLVTAFLPRTQSEIETRQWLALEWRRLEWEANRRPYSFDGSDEDPRDV